MRIRTQPLLLLACGLVLSCSRHVQEPRAVPARQAHGETGLQEERLAEYVSAMPIEEKVRQIFLVNLEGNAEFHPVEFDGAGDALIPGGYLFFSYNIGDSFGQTAAFVRSVKDYARSAGAITPLAAVDQEGGYVSRLRGITDDLPSQERVAAEYGPDAAHRLYSAQAEQMARLGFDLNLAPVVEVLSSENADFLDTRSFGSKEQVLSYGAAAIRGYQEHGVAAVLKHFPGNSNTDSHTGLPEITLSAQELEESAVSVFAELLRCRPEGVLMSHARTAAFDSAMPACLSEYWVQDVLRARLAYSGLILSDDIFMDALGKNGFPPDRAAVLALSAGVDMIMLSEKRFARSAEALVQHAQENPPFAARIDEAVSRVLSFKLRHGLFFLPGTSDGEE